MNTKSLNQSTVAVTSVVAAARATRAADATVMNDLVARIKDEKTRIAAWEEAAELGAPAVRVVGPLLADPDTEVTRAARRALDRIVHRAGRPGADAERKAVVKELLPLLANGQPVAVRRPVLWLISEIGGDEAVPPVAAILADETLREDARSALQRIPGKASLKALQDGFAVAPETFKYAIAESLRVRGVEVKGYPSQKLVPTKQTSLKPTGPV